MKSVATKEATGAPALLQELMLKFEPSQALLCVPNTPGPAESVGESSGVHCSSIEPTAATTSKPPFGQVRTIPSDAALVDENTGKNIISIYITHTILNCREIPSVSFNRLAYQMPSIQV